MANRNVFKILSSVGPGGCIAAFCEKICKMQYYDAYEQGDPADKPSEEFQEKAKQQRQDYVEELFEEKGNLSRQMLALQHDTKQQAYKSLCEIILKHKTLITKSEMSRLARERLFYKPQSVQYKRIIEKSRSVEADTIDNLIKMALHIIKDAEADMLYAKWAEVSGTEYTGDIEGGDIETRIPRARAQELLTAWKKILIEYKAEGNSVTALFSGQGGTSEGLINAETSEDLEFLKDKLFIAEAEDQLDTFEAFKHYELKYSFTDSDL